MASVPARLRRLENPNGSRRSIVFGLIVAFGVLAAAVPLFLVLPAPFVAVWAALPPGAVWLLLALVSVIVLAGVGRLLFMVVARLASRNSE